MSVLLGAMCACCRHWDGAGGCAAFASGIPEDLINEGRDHRRPYPGDEGIRFEPVDPGEWDTSLLRREMDGEVEDYWQNPAIGASKAGGERGG